jgi:ribosomal protein S16
MFTVKTLSALFVSSLLAGPAFAGVAAYTGPSGEKLFIEQAPSIGKSAHVIKFEGPASAWAGKPIVTELQERPSANRYAFEYDKKVGSRTKKQEYQIVVDDGFELVKGSRVKKVKLYFPESSGKPVVLKHDEALTSASQAINLAAESTKTPFKPQVP